MDGCGHETGHKERLAGENPMQACAIVQTHGLQTGMKGSRDPSQMSLEVFIAYKESRKC